MHDDAAANLRRFFDPRPRGIAEHHSAKLRALIAHHARHHPPDLVHIEHLHMAQYARLFPSTPRVLDMHDVLYRRLLRQIALARPSRASRLAGRIDALKAGPLERTTLRRFSAVLAVTTGDAALVHQQAPRTPVYIVPNGVDTRFFSPPSVEVREPSLIMTANFGYYPNIDGIRWFLREVWPLLRYSHPSLLLRLVGRTDRDETAELGHHDGVEIVGEVADVRPFVARSSVFIAPLRMGGGSRLKILEALAQGIPVVTTSVGWKGLELEPGRHLLVSDTPREFADSTSRLLTNPALRASLAHAGRTLVVERYDWDASSHKLEHAYSAVLGVP
jgi:glycosyltransferase involved in cell wall biosynthesis